MAKKKTASKKKKSLTRATAKELHTSDTEDSSVLDDSSVHTTAVAESSPPLAPTFPQAAQLQPQQSEPIHEKNTDSSVLSDQDDFSKPSLWLIAHQVIAVEHLAIRSTESNPNPIIITQTSHPNQQDQANLRQTLAHARRIYVDLFYIYFANEYSRQDSTKFMDFSIQLQIIAHSMNHAFKTVKNLVQLPNFELVILKKRPSSDAPYEVMDDSSSISSLISEREIMEQIPMFLSVLKSSLTVSDSDTQQTHAGINHMEVAQMLNECKEIKPLRQLLRYLRPYEAKALLSRVVFNLIEGKDTNSSFDFYDLFKNCLSKSVSRTLLADKLKEAQAKGSSTRFSILDVINKQSGTPCEHINYVTPLQLVDDLEFGLRLQYMREKADYLISQCDEFL